MVRFIKVGNGCYNVNYIHSITMNKDGQQGWMKVDNKDKEDGFERIRLSPQDYDRIEEILLTHHFEYQLKRTKEKA
jgi:hypothetical protein